MEITITFYRSNKAFQGTSSEEMSMINNITSMWTRPLLDHPKVRRTIQFSHFCDCDKGSMHLANHLLKKSIKLSHIYKTFR